MNALRMKIEAWLAEDPLRGQIIRFIIVGGICYVIGMSMLALLVEGLKMEVNLANAISSLITIFICYLLNARFIFETGRHSRQKEITIFYIFALIGLGLNIGLMYLMTTYVPIHYLISKTLIILFIACFNFLTRKFIVFNG